MTTKPSPEKRRMNPHVTESHQIFDRVTLLEANVSSLADSVNKLASSVQSTEATVGEIKSMISAVGKTDGKTILTLGGTIIGALAVLGSMFLGPIQRDLLYLDKQLANDERRIEQAIGRTDEIVRAASAMHGEMELVKWRLKALEGPDGK